MAAPDFEANAFTHDLSVKSAEYHEATTKILDIVLSRATTGFVRIEHDQLDTTFDDTPRCRETWEAVRDSVSWSDDARRGAWYRGELPDTAEEFRRLWSLTDRICGIHFVNEITLYDDDSWLFYVVPHHNYCWLHDPDKSFIAEIDAVLSNQRACLLPAGTQVEWERDGREYAISGTSLCVGGGGFRTCGCYGLSNLETVCADERTRTISLDWQPDPMSGVVGRVLMGAMSVVYNPPEQLQFEDDKTFREVGSVLRDILERREPSNSGYGGVR